MAHAFTPGLQVARLTTIRRRRELPCAGEIVVAQGALVKSTQEVARASLPGDLLILRLAEKMGIEPNEVMHGLKVREGDTVTTGTLLCEHSGLFGLLHTRFNAPIDGCVEFVAPRTGHVGIRMAPRSLTLDAYLSGRVVEVVACKSVVIEATCTFIQGIFGVGGERKGVLRMLPISPTQQIDVTDIPYDIKGAVLVGGTKPTLAALQAAAERGALGFVTGSIDDLALRGYLGFDLGLAITGNEPVTMTVIVTEGFGTMPLSERIRALLSVHEGKEVSINGATQVRAGAERPEIIVPLDTQSAATEQGVCEPLQTGLEVGSTVRLIRVPYFGLNARVVELPAEPQVLATGAYARVLKARLANGDTVVVPRANVELTSE